MVARRRNQRILAAMVAANAAPAATDRKPGRLECGGLGQSA